MVGVIIVSHSEKVAQGAKELAEQMAPQAPIAAAGGLPDGGIGTDYQRIHDAVEAVAHEDGAVVLIDMGSAIMTTEMVLEEFADKNVRMIDGPIVEGAIVAALGSQMGLSVEDIMEQVASAKTETKLA